MLELEAPYLVTLGFDRSTFERLDRLRGRYFPPESNLVPAHLCLFHHLPGDERDSIDEALARSARSASVVPLSFVGVKRIGRGMMLPVSGPGLAQIRSDLAATFARWLTPQDRQPFRPHVTIMNKADRAEVEAAFGEMQSEANRWTGLGDRLILWRYLGGPWDEVASYPLAGPITHPSSRTEA